MRGYQMNVEELDSRGRRRRLLCFLPEGRVPVGDIMLAQKIALELFESEGSRLLTMFLPATVPLRPMCIPGDTAATRRHVHVRVSL